MGKLIDKECKQCGKPMLQVSPYKKLCDDCAKENRQKQIDKANKDQKENNYSKLYEKYKNNFLEVTKNNGYTLTIAGFNEVSKLRYPAYRRFFKNQTWIDICKTFGKYEEVLNYILEEFKKYYNETNCQDLHMFGIKHKYISDNIILNIGREEILNKCGLRLLRNQDDDYENNFNLVKEKYNRVPLFNEFNEASKISMTTYANKFKLKGKIYDSIVKMYTTNEEYENYLKLSKEHKSEIGKVTSTMSKILLSKEELEIELKNIFDDFYKAYNKYPSIRLFEKISKRDKRTFEEKFGKQFKDICLDLGYDIEDKASAEYIVLKKISIILDDKCERQKTWKWLKGINDFPLWVDGYFKKYNLAIEFDGRQHKEPVADFGGQKAFETQQQNDKIKNELIPKHGIQLIRISAFENWYNEDYLKQKLISEGIINNQITK